MSYSDIKMAPDVPPFVRGVITKSIEPYLWDVHAMLRLPLDPNDDRGGCNFSLVVMLCCVIGAISQVIHPRQVDLSPEEGPDWIYFKTLMEKYPWDLEPTGTLKKEEAIGKLYTGFRNPLVHAAGTPAKAMKVEKEPKKRMTFKVGEDRFEVMRWKHGLTEKAVEKIETRVDRPSDWPATLSLGTNNQTTTLFVEGLYWGVRQMIERLLGDQHIVRAAENHLKAEFDQNKKLSKTEETYSPGHTISVSPGTTIETGSSAFLKNKS